MTPEQRDVRDFHVAAGFEVADRPRLLDTDTMNLALRLIREEASEVHRAAATGDLAGVAGELVDLLYVTYGMAVRMGIDLEPVWHATQAANMRKLEGGPRFRADGKLLKPAGWVPADVASLVLMQRGGGS